MSTPRILMVEDDAELREGMAAYVRLLGFDVVAVGDGLSFYQRIAQADFAVVLIDLGLPDQAGEVLVDYTRRNTSSAIVVVTARDTIDTRVRCYEIGADLFLPKPVDGRELTAALKSLVARREAPSRVHAHDGAWRLERTRRLLTTADGTVIELTPREFDFVALVASAGGAPRPRLDLLEALYGRTDESADRALETLVRRTRQNIAARSSEPVPILTHHGVGYAFVAPVHVVD